MHGALAEPSGTSTPDRRSHQRSDSSARPQPPNSALTTSAGWTERTKLAARHAPSPMTGALSNRTRSGACRTLCLGRLNRLTIEPLVFEHEGWMRRWRSYLTSVPLQIVRRQISRDDSSLPSLRVRLSQAPPLPAAIVQRGRRGADVSFCALNPACCQISTRFRPEACRVA